MSGIELPTSPRLLWDSRQECHDELLALCIETEMEIVAAGGKRLPFSTFYRDFRRAWEVWSKFCPASD